MLQYNSQDSLQLENLNKFARFITKRFGVQIVFESASAKADNENVIYLPSIVGLSNRDVDFLFRITLHEVGHIKFTNYKAPNDLIKTENHFRLINAVEDARIENLLMDEYDGAHDMFESLYNDFAADHRYMQRIFGFDPKDCDIWYFLGVYLHDYLVKISPKTPLSKLYGKKNANKLAKLVQKLKLDSYLQNAKLKTWNDAVEIATEVYNRFVKHLKDQSEKIDVQKTEDSKKEIKKALNDAHKKIEKLVNDIADATQKLSEMRDEYDQANEERLDNLQAAQNERDNISRRIANGNRHLKDYDKSLRKYGDAIKAKDKRDKYEKEVSDLQNTLSDLQKQMQQIDAATDLTKQQKKIQKKIDNTSNKLQTRQQQIVKQDNFYKERKDAADQYSTMSSEQAKKLREDLKQYNSDFKEACKEVGKYSELTDVEKEYRKIEQKKSDAQDKISSEIQSSLSDIQKEVIKQNLPALEGMPGYESNEEWQDSDAAQQDFDQRASKESNKVVINGRQFSVGSGRDILALIDKSIEDVNDFNVLEHFAEATTDDKLKNFNEINNTTIFSDDTKTFSTNEKHVALTTQYDRTVNKETSNGVELSKLKRKHHVTIETLKTIFKNRLKFNRRDIFKANQEDGSLDNRALWKIAANVDPDDSRVFERIVPKYVNKNVASIVVDISGSLDKAYTNYGEKLRELSLFLSEALSAVHIDHEIVGVHAPVSQEMREQNASSIYNRRSNLLENVIYKRFENKRNVGIQNIEVECADNSDGESLRTIAKNLMKRGAKSKMIFYITDGKPFLSDANLNILDSDLHRTIQWLGDLDIKVFAFGFNADPKKFFKDQYCEIKHWNDLLNFCNKKL